MSLASVLYTLLLPLIYLIRFFIPAKYFMKDITSETILITGGGNGLGRCLALKLSDLGAHIIIVDGNRYQLEETSRMIIKSGGTCSSYHCDLSRRDYVYTIAEKIKESNGFISMVINTAEVQGASRRLSELNDERIIKTIEVNTLSHIWFIKAFLPEMKLRNHGHIVSIASYAGILPSLALADFCASKFAIVGLTESLSLELKRDGYDNIHTTLVCPYLINNNLHIRQRNSWYKVSPVDINYLADQIISAIRLNKQQLIVPRLLNFLFIIKTIFPPVIGSQVHNLLKKHSVPQSITHNGHLANSASKFTILLNNNELPLDD